MRLSFLVILLLIFNISCGQIKSKSITEVSQKELKNVILIDVRTPEEFMVGHMNNALNINWFDENFVEQFSEISKDKTIYVYCKAGVRSKKAQQKLLALGYKNVIDLEGGYMALDKNVKQK